MKNNLCLKCDGRGFHWLPPSYLVDHNTGQIKADMYKPGPTCFRCHGTGTNELHPAIKLTYKFFGFIFLILLIILLKNLH